MNPTTMPLKHVPDVDKKIQLLCVNGLDEIPDVIRALAAEEID